MQADDRVRAGKRASDVTFVPLDGSTIDSGGGPQRDDGITGRTGTAVRTWAPGLIGEVAQWIDDCAIYPAPALAVAGAISIVQTAMGRRWASSTGARGMSYVVGLARTGVGKETARQCAVSLLNAAGLKRRVGADEMTSGAAVVTCLRSCPTQLFLIDEIGLLLESWCGKNAASHERSIMTALMKLWSSGAGTYLGRAYAEKPAQSVEQPHTVIYATSTPARFWEALKGRDVLDGVVNRLIIIEAAHAQLSERTPTAHVGEPPAALVAALKEIARPRAWTLEDVESPDLRTTPISVQLDEGARAGWAAIGENVRKTRLQKDGPEADLWVRAREQAGRLALTAAVGRGSATVSADDLAWSWRLVRHATALTASKIRDSVADTEEGRCALALLAAVRRNKSGRATRSDLTRAAWRWPRQVREAAVNGLLDTGRLVVYRAQGGRSAAEVFVLSDEPTS